MTESAGAHGLPRTSYAVLGLLSFREMSGYDVKSVADRSISHFYWAPAKSQVYSELRRLVRLGLATEQEVAQEGRPDKRIYRITEAGRRTLRDWVSEPGAAPDSLKSEFMLKVFLGAEAPRHEVAARIREAAGRAEEQLTEYRAVEASLEEGGEGTLFPLLTLKAGIAHALTFLEWADMALARLEQGEEEMSMNDENASGAGGAGA
ncbi:MAG: PadR family transcriptional regulator [Chloroflexota bacterium]